MMLLVAPDSPTGRAPRGEEGGPSAVPQPMARMGPAPCSQAQRVAVFAGTAAGDDPRYRSLAVGLGYAAACRGLGVVIGAGASAGLAGTVADAAHLAGGRVLGVVPHGLWGDEDIPAGVDEVHSTPDLAQHLLLMLELADCCVGLPGGVGTLAEILALLRLRSLGLAALPLGILDCDDYYAPLRALLERGATLGFITSDLLDRGVSWHRDADVLLDHLLAVTAAASTRAERAEAFASQRTGGSTVRHRVQSPVTPASRDPTAGAAPADAVEERLS